IKNRLLYHRFILRYSLLICALIGTSISDFFVCVIYKIAAMTYQANTMSHSEGQANEDGMPGKYIAINKTLRIIAMLQTIFPFLIRYGLGNTGLTLCNFINEIVISKLLNI